MKWGPSMVDEGVTKMKQGGMYWKAPGEMQFSLIPEPKIEQAARLAAAIAQFKTPEMERAFAALLARMADPMYVGTAAVEP